MPTKTALKRGFKANAERISENFRDELGISKFDPLDAFELAKFLKVPIYPVSEMKNELPREIFDKLSDVNKFSALWLPNSDGEKIIVHNTFHSKKRQQSNLMHELSHIILNHTIPDEQARLCHLLGLHYYNEEHEQEAKYLGGCLQITRVGLLWALNNSYSEIEISNYYTASTEMVNYRLRISGVLRQRANYFSN